MLDKWAEAINNGHCIDVVYCDFIDWIKSFLTNRKQRVLVNGIASGLHDIISGMPQGSVLVPILFLIYINTVIDIVQHSDLFLFADDNKLFKIIFNDEDTITAKICFFRL